MTRDEAVADIKVQLGFKTSLDATIVTALQTAQEEAEKAPYLPLFLRSAITTPVTIAATEAVALPTGFLREWNEDGLYYYNSSLEYVPLVKDTIAHNRLTFPGVGQPQGYSITEGSFLLFPTPDAVYNLKIIYYKADEVLSSDIENQWLRDGSKFLRGEAGKKVAFGLRDIVAYNQFERMAFEGMKDIRDFEVAQEEEGRTVSMGGAD